MAAQPILPTHRQPIPELKGDNSNKLTNALVTVIALLAIGAVVVGVLTIVASLPGGPSGLNALSRLTWMGGTAFAAAGVLTLIGLMIFMCVRHCRKSEQPVVDANPVDDNPLNQILRQLGITDPDAHYRSLYGEEPPENLFIPPNKNNAGRVNQFQRTLKLVLFTDEQILQLTPQEIASFSADERTVLSDRLGLIDTKQVDCSHYRSQRDWTLGKLRVQAGGRIKLADIPQPFQGLLTAAQLEKILTKPGIDRAMLHTLLPSDSKYTYLRFIELKQDTLRPHLSNLTCEHFRLLPAVYFASDTFPWDLVIDTPEHLKTVLGTEINVGTWNGLNFQFTQTILDQVDTPKLLQLVPYLGLEHLSLLPPRVLILSADKFPWGDLIAKKPGIGKALHTISKAVFLQLLIPWKDFAGKQAEIDDLLSLDDLVFAYNLLQTFDLATVQQLAPHLAAWHICFVHPDILRSTNFPWPAFSSKAGIGDALHHFTAAFLLTTHIKWDALKKEDIKMVFDPIRFKKHDSLLSDAESPRGFASHILSNIERPVLERLVSSLDPTYLSVIPVSYRNDPVSFPWPQFINDPLLEPQHLAMVPEKYVGPTFPWKNVIRKQGIGQALHSYTPEFLLTWNIPWREFGEGLQDNRRIEVSALLSSSENNYHFARILLRTFDLDTVQRLGTSLAPVHLCFMDRDVLRSPNFLWSTFMPQKGIASALHFLGADFLLTTSIKFEECLDNEIESLFSLKDGPNDGTTAESHRDFTKKVLPTLEIPALQKLAPKLSPAHIALLPAEKQQALMPADA